MNFTTYGWVVLGIVISVVLPILWQTVYVYFPKPRPPGSQSFAPITIAGVWRLIAPYLILGVASALTAILIVAISGDSLVDYRAALLAGYAWDSTLQKLRG